MRRENKGRAKGLLSRYAYPIPSSFALSVAAAPSTLACSTIQAATQDCCKGAACVSNDKRATPRRASPH